MTLLVLAAFLGGCCFAPTASAPASPPVVASAPAAVGPTGPAAPGCSDIATTILGTWSRDALVEEYGAGGTYSINGQPGTIVWARPGHATLEVPGSGFHAEYDLALVDATTLLAVDANGAGTVYQRTSPPPAIPAECFDLRTAWVGTWLPTLGGPPERYDADGHYQVVGAGTWSFTTPGHLHLVREDGVTSDYLIGMVSTGAALAVSLPPLPPSGVAYTRQP